MDDKAMVPHDRKALLAKIQALEERLQAVFEYNRVKEDEEALKERRDKYRLSMLGPENLREEFYYYIERDVLFLIMVDKNADAKTLTTSLQQVLSILFGLASEQTVQVDIYAQLECNASQLITCVVELDGDVIRTFQDYFFVDGAVANSRKHIFDISFPIEDMKPAETHQLAVKLQTSTSTADIAIEGAYLVIAARGIEPPGINLNPEINLPTLTAILSTTDPVVALLVSSDTAQTITPDTLVAIASANPDVSLFVVYERYQTGDDAQLEIYGDQWEGQTFTPQVSHGCDRIGAKLYRTGAPGTVTAEIYETSAGLPTGTAIAAGTFDGDSLGTGTAGAWQYVGISADTYPDVTFKDEDLSAGTLTDAEYSGGALRLKGVASASPSNQWKFASNWNDSVGSSNLTNSGMTLQSRTDTPYGTSTVALNSGGDSNSNRAYVSGPLRNRATLEAADGWTVAFWMCPRASSGVHAVYWALGTITSSGDLGLGVHINGYSVDRPITARQQDGSADFGSALTLISATSTATWYFVALVGNTDGTIRCYSATSGDASIADKGSIANTKNFGNNALDWTVGNCRGLTTGARGDVEHVLLYHRALNATQLQELYEQTSEDGAIPAVYISPGTRLSPAYDLSSAPTNDLKIQWSATTPTGTTLTVATAVNSSDTVPPDPGDFAAQTSGTLISNIPAGSLSGKYLWIKQTLSTTDTSATPSVSASEVYYVSVTPVPGAVPLTASTKYALVLRCGGDASNKVHWRNDASSPTYTGGARVSSSNAGASWAEDTTRDYMFEEGDAQ